MLCTPRAVHDTGQVIRGVDEAVPLHRLHHQPHRRADDPDRAVLLVRGPSIPAASLEENQGRERERECGAEASKLVGNSRSLTMPSSKAYLADAWVPVRAKTHERSGVASQSTGVDRTAPRALLSHAPSAPRTHPPCRSRRQTQGHAPVAAPDPRDSKPRRRDDRTPPVHPASFHKLGTCCRRPAPDSSAVLARESSRCPSRATARPVSMAAAREASCLTMATCLAEASSCLATRRDQQRPECAPRPHRVARSAPVARATVCWAETVLAAGKL